jgi:hypothetical protein
LRCLQIRCTRQWRGLPFGPGGGKKLKAGSGVLPARCTREHEKPDHNKRHSWAACGVAVPRRCSIYFVGAVGTEVSTLSLEHSALESKWAPDPMLVQQEYRKQECPQREPTAGERNARPSSVCQAHNSRQRRQPLKRNTRDIEGSGALKGTAESGHPSCALCGVIHDI